MSLLTPNRSLVTPRNNVVSPRGFMAGRPSGGGSRFTPNMLPNLELWCRHNSGITVTGAGVSQWDDASGNGNHLLQGTDTNRPLQGSLESDLVTNGDFATDTDWIKGAGWTIAAGVATKSGGGATFMYQNYAFTSGAVYQATYTISNYSAGSVSIQCGGVSGTSRSANGTYTEQITAGASGTYLLLADATFAADIDDVIIQKIDPTAGILFDGGDNYLRATFTLNQPCSWYILGKWVVWSTNHVMNGVTANVAVFGNTATPGLALYAGTSVVALNNDWAVGAYAPMVTVFDGASSLIQVGSNSPTTGNPGASNPGGFTLGNSDVVASPSNIQVKEVAIYSVAHDAATRTKVINYLNSL